MVSKVSKVSMVSFDGIVSKFSKASVIGFDGVNGAEGFRWCRRFR